MRAVMDGGPCMSGVIGLMLGPDLGVQKPTMAVTKARIMSHANINGWTRERLRHALEAEPLLKAEDVEEAMGTWDRLQAEQLKAHASRVKVQRG